MDPDQLAASRLLHKSVDLDLHRSQKECISHSDFILFSKTLINDTTWLRG